MTNCITTIAARDGRSYITPEDVAEALHSHRLDRVRRDVLAVLGGEAEDFGAEDPKLCAYIAFKGRRMTIDEPPPLSHKAGESDRSD